MENISENSKVAKAAGVVGAATMVSRIFGVIRDMVIAGLFGANWITDAFWIAFRIPNMLRRLLGEGSLTISFVPVFTDYLQNKTRQESLDLASSAFTLLSIILVVISILGIIFSPVIITLSAWGFVGNPEQFELAVFLNRIMFPYIFFIALVALCMGILNSLRHFAAPALSPVMLNIAMIAAALLLRDVFSLPITALAVGVLIGGVLQLAMQLPVLLKYGIKFKFKINLQHPGLKQIGMLMLPAIFSAGVGTINVLITGMILASMLPSGSVTYLFYADRIMELPLGIFAIAIGTAALPSFSKCVAEGNMDELKNNISYSLRIMLFLTIPAMVALMYLNIPIISVLFQRGSFDARAATLTGQALFCYTIGLWAFSVLRVFISSFFALKDSKWPLKAAVITLIVNVVVSVVLMFPLKHNGIALGLSISSIVQVMILAIVLKRKIGVFLDRIFYLSLFKIIFSSVVMLAALIMTDVFLPWDISAKFELKIAYLIISVIAGAMTFFVSSYILKSPEIYSLINLLKKRFTHSTN
ncbi:MAG: murein biosynthesis integral membrane protein MurJ [Syntrophaceae bacterium]|nr:murein biosynthesis integral membrane protein MurJ [Syntrophaceae bacterium]